MSNSDTESEADWCICPLNVCVCVRVLYVYMCECVCVFVLWTCWEVNSASPKKAMRVQVQQKVTLLNLSEKGRGGK